MRIAVTDANIFIDLIFLELHILLFELNLEIYTTNFVLDELDDEQVLRLEPLISEGKLIVYPFTDQDLDELSKFSIRRSLSTADHSVLFIAGKLEALLISGDSVLRRACEEMKTEVHGVLWIFDEFIKAKQLPYKIAHKKLTDLKKFNKRLPEKDCNSRLLDWSEKF